MREPWNFEDALPCLRRFASTMMPGYVDPLTAEYYGREAIKSVLARKLPVSDGTSLQVELYRTMLDYCRQMERTPQETTSNPAASSIAPTFHRLSRDERESLALVVIEGIIRQPRMCSGFRNGCSLPD